MLREAGDRISIRNFLIGVREMTNIKDIWAAAITELGKALSKVAVDTWFGDIEAVELDENTLYLYCESGFRVMIIEQRFINRVQEALEHLLGDTIRVSFLTEEQYRKRIYEEKAERTHSDFGKEFTFGTFVVGASNQVAYVAAKEVAEKYERYRNPLVIYGNSGLGKTHLLNAIANEALRQDPLTKVTLIKGDEFTNELIGAIHAGSSAQLREKYRTADLFLMDDVQFIAGKRQTQEEFFNTFEALYNAGSRIVITLDRPPRELETLEKRLLNRFEGGLIVEVSAPERHLREAIVRTKASLRGLVLTADEIAYISERLTDNVRQIEGLLNQVKAYRSISGDRGAGVNLVAALTDKMAGESRKPMNAADALGRLCAELGVEKDLVIGRTQRREVTTARQTIIYVLCKGMGLSASEVGRLLHRDHTTVAYAVQSIEQKMKGNGELSKQIQALVERCS